MGQQIAGTAAHPIQFDRDAVIADPVGCRCEADQDAPRLIQGGALGGESVAPGGRDATDLDARRRQPLVGIVGPQHKAVLGARRKHAVGLRRPQGHQVVDHDADIGLRPVEDEAVATARRQGGVDAGHQALGGGLFIAGGAVNLPGQEQPRRAPGLQRGFQFPGVDVVVFDGIAGPRHDRVLEAGNGFQQETLDVLGERRGDAVGINGGIVQAFRLKKDAVAVAVAEPHHLVLDGRAVAGTGRLDLPRIEGRAMKVFADQLVGVGRRRGDGAIDLWRLDTPGEERERLGRIVALLNLKATPVDGAAIEPGRRPRLHTAEGEAEAFEGIGQADRRSLADAAGGDTLLANVDQATQEGAGGQDDGVAQNRRAAGDNDATDPAVTIED